MVTNTEANKKVIDQLLEAFSRGDVPALVEMMTDDATWWVSGRIDRLSGTYGRDDFARLVEGAKSAYKTGALKIWSTGMVAEGDKVAVEAESHAELLNGRIYSNFYHLLVTVRDGKVASVKEYCDTLHMKQVFFD
ncbi:MAG: nuclear transport factor 2 family protein [Novosphingobium sp.]|nr:nuclear transport factor 2 family protein [Novosphingobium sp.]